ncbi:MAG: hypothetical protein U0637_08170 [Phycisphaerales bacterium]
MAPQAAPGEQYTIRRKVFKLFGASFHIYNEQGAVVGYCNQKAFKLREDIRIYTDESMQKELLRINTQQIIDFSAAYTVALGDGTVLGIMKRKGLKSTFLRDEWLILSPQGAQLAVLRERGSFMAFLRRWIDYVALFSPQKFDLIRDDGSHAAAFRQHFNWFVYRLGVAITRDDKDRDDGIDDMMILAMGCLICAIEGRQSNA